MPTILTIDLGTTYFKVGLFDHEGTLLHLDRVAPPVQHPQPGQWELPVTEFLATVRAAIGRLRIARNGGLNDVAAVTFATQANSFVLMDERNEPFTSLILWPDERANPADPRIMALSNLPDFRGRTGIPALGPQFMIAKLLWLRQNQPQVWQRARRLCHLSDYLTFWLTGQHVTEGGVAGLTGLLDIAQLDWWPKALEMVGLPSNWLPHVVRAGTDLGPIRPAIAGEIGLPASCRFIVGCLDQYAGAIGAGNLQPGGVSETTGTVLATVTVLDQLPTSPADGVFIGPAYAPDRYFAMSFGNTSANLLDWYRSTLPGSPDYADLGRLAAARPACSAGLVITPYAGGGPMAASFNQVRPGHSIGQVVRAIMEAAARALADQVHSLSPAGRPHDVRSAGGAATSDFWCQIKADILGIPILAPTCPEPTSLGAALLAARALNWGDLGDIIPRWVKIRRAFHPSGR